MSNPYEHIILGMKAEGVVNRGRFSSGNKTATQKKRVAKAVQKDKTKLRVRALRAIKKFESEQSARSAYLEEPSPVQRVPPVVLKTDQGKYQAFRFE